MPPEPPNWKEATESSWDDGEAVEKDEEPPAPTFPYFPAS
jgi:hypothetical protein